MRLRVLQTLMIPTISTEGFPAVGLLEGFLVLNILGFLDIETFQALLTELRLQPIPEGALILTTFFTMIRVVVLLAMI